MAKRRKGGTMRQGECRVTRKGIKYCMGPSGVRFVGRGSRSLSGGRGGGPAGRHCIRWKSGRGKYGQTIRRCAEFSGGLGDPGRIRTCIRTKRVRSRSGRMVTRCASYR